MYKTLANSLTEIEVATTKLFSRALSWLGLETDKLGIVQDLVHIHNMSVQLWKEKKWEKKILNFYLHTPVIYSETWETK